MGWRFFGPPKTPQHALLLLLPLPERKSGSSTSKSKSTPGQEVPVALRELSAARNGDTTRSDRPVWFKPVVATGAFFLKGFLVDVHRTDVGTIECLAPEPCDLCAAELSRAELLYGVVLLKEQKGRQALCEFHSAYAERLSKVEPGTEIRVVLEGAACRLVQVSEGRITLPAVFDFERYLRDLWSGRRACLLRHQQRPRDTIPWRAAQ